MNCPHCQQEISPSHKSNRCPARGRDFHATSRRQNRFTGLTSNYLRVFGLLAAPAIVTVASARLEWFLFAVLGIAGSIAAGIYCARLVVWEYDVTGVKAALLQFAVALALCVISLTISYYFGCSFALGNS